MASLFSAVRLCCLLLSPAAADGYFGTGVTDARVSDLLLAIPHSRAVPLRCDGPDPEPAGSRPTRRREGGRLHPPPSIPPTATVTRPITTTTASASVPSTTTTTTTSTTITSALARAQPCLLCGGTRTSRRQRVLCSQCIVTGLFCTFYFLWLVLARWWLIAKP